jgi:hypothetical protein
MSPGYGERRLGRGAQVTCATCQSESVQFGDQQLGLSRARSRGLRQRAPERRRRRGVPDSPRVRELPLAGDPGCTGRDRTGFPVRTRHSPRSAGRVRVDGGLRFVRRLPEDANADDLPGIPSTTLRPGSDPGDGIALPWHLAAYPSLLPGTCRKPPDKPNKWSGS